MKKYKLIKEYPGSPELNSIVTVSTKGSTLRINGTWVYSIGVDTAYWQEQVGEEHPHYNLKRNSVGIIKSIHRKFDNVKISAGDQVNIGANYPAKVIETVDFISISKDNTVGVVLRSGRTLNASLVKVCVGTDCNQKQIHQGDDVYRVYISYTLTPYGKAYFTRLISKRVYKESDLEADTDYFLDNPGILMKSEEGATIYCRQKVYVINDNKVEQIRLGTTALERVFIDKDVAESYLLRYSNSLSLNDILHLGIAAKDREALVELVKTKIKKDE